jgi:hypothetical protein
VEKTFFRELLNQSENLETIVNKKDIFDNVEIQHFYVENDTWTNFFKQIRKTYN